jgi:hypothetical protein
MAVTDMHAITEGLLETVCSVRSVPRIYNEDESLETAVRRVGGCCEMSASLGVT